MMHLLGGYWASRCVCVTQTLSSFPEVGLAHLLTYVVSEQQVHDPGVDQRQSRAVSCIERSGNLLKHRANSFPYALRA